MRDEKTAIESIALGLLDGGGEVFTNFPGYMSHKLFSSLGGKITSVNEKIAYEVAWGSCFAGKRSAVMFKNVGLDDAADPFLNSMVVGTNAGLVVIVFDDVFVEGSQSRQDSRHYFDFFGGLWLEPYSVQSAYNLSYKAFSFSERFQVPVIIRVTNQLVGLTGNLSRKRKQNKSMLPICDHKRFVVHPVNSKYQRDLLDRKNKNIRNFVDGLYNKTQIKTKKNLLIFGPCKTEEQKYLKKGFSATQIFTYPLPKIVSKFIRKSDEIVILEQGNDFAYQKISREQSRLDIKSDTGLIPDKSKGYIISPNYEKIYKAIKKLRISVLVGDLGEYTKDTLDSVDAVLCFGSSVSVAMGCLLAGNKRVFSITGDASYLHSGKNAIIEAIERKLPVKVIIICNGGSQGTGGQIIPGDLYYQPKSVEVFKMEYQKSSQLDFEKILAKMARINSVSVLYVQM